MPHTHPHTHTHSHQKGRNLLLTVILNILITLSQIIGGFISGSLALLSDALHNFTDVVSLVVSYIAYRLSKRKASPHRTFGFKRAEIIAAFINASTLLVVAFLLIIEAVKHFLHPAQIGANIVIWLSLLGIVANGFSALLLRRDAGKNLNIRSAYLHLLTDTLASVAVLAGGLLMKYYQIYQVDSILTFLIAVYLIYVGYGLFRESARMLMLFTPQHINLEEVAREVNQIPKVNKLHHIHIWGLNEDELHLEAHLDLKEDVNISEFNTILSEIEERLHHKFQINHVNIQPEFNKEDPKDLIVQD